jgi:hypothetical protein
MRPIWAILSMALFLALAPMAFASTTWYVNGTTGSDNNDCKSPTTACKTIGHAISLAASGDSISVAAATYTENLTIGVSLSLIGSGASTTIIAGAQKSTVITVSITTAHVALSNVTITNGLAQVGGGILNHGALTLNNIVVSRNTASGPSGCKSGCGGAGGGIYNDGMLMIKNSTVSGNTSTVPFGCLFGCANGGGGIENGLGAVTVNDSTISENTASNSITRSGAGGGGILNSGTVTLNNSTVAFNSATGIFGTGGGIANESTALKPAQFNANNSTFASNTASMSGGGIYNSGKVTLQNTIVATSSGGNCVGGVTSNGYNLSSDGTCNFNNTGDLNNTDPQLGPLQKNGGPTETMALPSGSPAIDAGNAAGCTDNKGNLLKTDQRGMPRPDKEDTGGCDMGAYESQSD